MALATPDAQARLDRLLAQTGDPLQPAGTAAAQPNPIQTLSPGREMGNVFHFSGSVAVHVYAPSPPPGSQASPVAAPVVAVPAALAVSIEKALLFDPDYTARSGYDPAFLGTRLALPSVAEAFAQELYLVGDYNAYFDAERNVPEIAVEEDHPASPLLLHYHHYSLVFNKRYKMCHWTALNCDYRELVRQDPRNRTAFGGERWRYDPRVPRQLRLADDDIYAPARRIERGHIVRREDTCWGAPGIDTDYANADSYHWTNCTPQHEAFNKESPSNQSKNVYQGLGFKGIWGHFEAELQEQLAAGGDQATLFAGPVLDGFFVDVDWGKGKIRVPKQFWKVVVVPASKAKRPQLRAYGYLFDQSAAVSRFGMTFEKELALPQFERNRCTLARISALAGVLFPAELLAAEQP